jgi:hypothetical protein
MGCASSGRLPPEPAEFCTVDNSVQIAGIRMVALAADVEPPTIETVTLGHTHGEGVTGGAATGAAGGAALAANIALSGDPSALLTGVLLSPFLVVGGTVGGAVVGGVTGHSPDQLAEAEANAKAMLEPTIFQTELLKRTQDYGNANIDLEFIEIPSVPPESPLDDQSQEGFSNQSIDAVLEIGLVRIKLDRFLEMEARSRLVSARTNDILSENRHTFRSSSRSLKEWTEDGATRLSEEIQFGFQRLAENIVDDNFVLFQREEHRNLAKADSGNPARKVAAAKEIFTKNHFGEPGSEFSPALLETQEGKSALVIYRTEHLTLGMSAPVIINDKFLSTLPANSFDCLIVEPGTNTVTYPSQFAPFAISSPNEEDYEKEEYKNIRIITVTTETGSNEILYFRVKYTGFLPPQGISGELVSEKEAMHELKRLRRANMQIIKHE